VGAYLHAGEMGYEVSQSNAAYILRTKLVAPTRSFVDALQVAAPESAGAAACGSDATAGAEPHRCLSSEETSVAVWEGPQQRRDRLLARLYALSAHGGNKESYLHLGTCYFKGLCGVGAVDQTKALWYYSKASYLGAPLSSAYLGVMYHFGLGVAVNLPRAQRYYSLALTQGADQTVAVMIQSLKYALTMKNYYFLMPVNLGVEYVVRTLWQA
jgi:TPR repeat protein